MEKIKRKKDSFALISLILGIFSFVHLLGMEKGILALIFGLLALKRISRSGEEGRGFAIGGMILGILSIVLIITVLTLYPEILEALRESFSKTLKR